MTDTTEEPLNEEDAQFAEEGNVAVASSISGQIKTPEELLEVLGVDMEIWVKERAIVNKWPIARRKDKKDLVFEDGKITGTIEDKGDMTVQELIQVKVWLLKRKPDAIEPVIAPISLNIKPIGIPRSRSSRRKRGLLIFDPHFGFRKDARTGALSPFHDRRAISIAIQLAAKYLPDVTVWGGDILDLAEWSDKFVRSPDMRYCTQPAIVEASWTIGQTRQYSQEQIVMLGNHDIRMEDAISNHLSQVYFLRPANKLQSPPILSVPYLLALEDMDVQYISNYPDGVYYVNDALAVVHGDKARSPLGGTAAATLNDSLVSKVFGHAHRRELVSKTLWYHGEPKVVEAFSPGTVGKIDGSIPGSEGEPTWQQGVAFVEYDDEGYNADLIPIENGRAYYRGEYFVAEDYRPQLYELEYFKQQRELKDLLEN